MSRVTYTARGHRYTIDGQPVPSVTTILRATVAKPALPYWSARTVAEYVIDQGDAVDVLRGMGRGPAVAALKAVPWQARDVAAGQGTLIHRLGEDLVHGRAVDVPRTLVPYVDGYARWLDAHHVVPRSTEVVVWNPDTPAPYAGRADLEADVDGVPMLLDLKTGSGVYPEAALQLAAYEMALYWVDGDNEQRTRSEGRPHGDMGVVHVTATGTTLHRVVDPAWARTAWRRALDLYPYARVWTGDDDRRVWSTDPDDDGGDDE